MLKCTQMEALVVIVVVVGASFSWAFDFWILFRRMQHRPRLSHRSNSPKKKALEIQNGRLVLNWIELKWKLRFLFVEIN